MLQYKIIRNNILTWETVKTPQERIIKNMTTNERDALNNIGLPQLADKNELEKKDIKLIKEQIKTFDNYYLDNSFKESNTRKILRELVNNFCVNYRCYSLIIE